MGTSLPPSVGWWLPLSREAGVPTGYAGRCDGSVGTSAAAWSPGAVAAVGFEAGAGRLGVVASAIPCRPPIRVDAADQRLSRTPLDADLVARRWFGWRVAAWRPAHLISGTTVATRPPRPGRAPRDAGVPARRGQPRASCRAASSGCLRRLWRAVPTDGHDPDARLLRRPAVLPGSGVPCAADGSGAQARRALPGQRDSQLILFHLDPDRLALPGRHARDASRARHHAKVERAVGSSALCDPTWAGSPQRTSWWTPGRLGQDRPAVRSGSTRPAAVYAVAGRS